jgi:hypothetical protein
MPIDRTEWRLTLTSCVVLCQAAAALHMFGFPRVLRWAGRPPRGGRRADPSILPSQIARAMGRAVRHAPVEFNCLSRSMALIRLLGRHHIDADLRLGVRRTSGQFEAHAWVEHDGVVLNDAADVAARFTPLSPGLRLDRRHMVG